MGRVASLILVTKAGALLGMLPQFELACPFWPESADVVAEADRLFDVRIVVLRLLDSDPSLRSGGKVSYLAELHSAGPEIELLPIPDVLRERAQRRDAKRMPWAELGGPAESLAWASATLQLHGRASFRAVQQRTWNLSTLWRLDPTEATTDPPIWLKQVPHFMKHESEVLRWLNSAMPGAAPTLVAADASGRSLLAHVDGEDLYGAPASTRLLILERLHQAQCAATPAVDELLTLGVPDRRGAKRVADSAQKLRAWLARYPALPDLLEHLAQQTEFLESSGVPATLVHADNHPGNARGPTGGVTLLDWGEAFIGHPVTDLMGLVEGLSAQEATPVIERWCWAWKQVAPRSRPEMAVEAAPFIVAMQGAATYAHFLEQIEETEWPYHLEDVPRCLEIAARLARAAKLA